jgi:FKBP-type peptidyl-prolyl cis-trans isomerase FkpA/FKBP-type peptidyl-prolyl cis-trans isomerase FklB
MATPRSQRIGIWAIAIVLTLGTLGSFLVMGLSVRNQSVDQAQQQKQYDEYLKQQKLASQLNADNSEPLAGYSARIFDPANVTKLNVEVLTEGTGEVIKATDSINSSYFGWTSDGKIFDSSKKKSTDDTPITFPLSGVIPGWTEGLTGVKVGSVVRLTIPSDKAYGAQGSGNIPADSPLEFIVEIHKIDNTAKK